MSEAAARQLKPAQLMPIVAIPIFLAIANQTMISVALPQIGSELGAIARLPWLVIGYMLALTIAGPVYGVLGDGYGRPRLLTAALWVYLAGALLCAVAPSLEVLAAGRVLQGLGGGGLMSLSQALIGQLVAPRDRGRAQGFVATIGVTASTLGPLLGGLLVEATGWRSLFLATVPLALLAYGILWRFRLPNLTSPARGFDLRGFLALVLFVGAWTGGLELLKEPGRALAGWAVLAAGAGALSWLVATQRRSANPLFPPRLFAISAIRRASVLVVCHGAALVSLVTLLPLFQSILRGDTTYEMAGMLLALTVSFGISGIVTGNLITMTGRAAIFPALSLPIAIAGIAAAGLWGGVLPYWALGLLYAVIGLTIGTVMASVHTIVQHAAPDDLRGRAAGAVTFFRSIGAVLGTALVTLVLFAFAPLEGADAGAIFAGGIPADAGQRAAWDAAFRAAFLTVALFAAGGWSMATTLRKGRIT